MNVSKTVLLTGARDSNLSLRQTRQNTARLQRLLPEIDFKLIPMSSPGDRDRESDLRTADEDFFTRDLDEAVLNSRLDCAFHSAKDLPSELCSGLDMFYLPWCEDRRDVLVYPLDRKIPAAPVIGVSSERRASYAKRRFPEGKIRSIRGNIESRLQQLDEGKYDILIMAAAALLRLDLTSRISEYIDPRELPTPDGQGAIAVTFRGGDQRFKEMRKLFVHRVVFAGAGIGSMDNTTTGVVRELKNCDVCLHDALCPQELLKLLPENATALSVGKRSGRHSYSQEQICRLLVDYARQGKKVVRLKGGDPCLFGRLAEETAALDKFELPYTVMPGVSSLAAATAESGLLLTRRDVCRGFSVATPRRAGQNLLEHFSHAERNAFTGVYFMAAGEIAELSTGLMSEGYPKDTPAAVIYNAGYPDRKIITGTISTIAGKIPDTSMPGIILTGECAGQDFLYKKHGALAGMKVLFAGSGTLAAKAAKLIEDLDGTAVLKPMLELIPKTGISWEKLLNTDYLLIPSPSCAEILLTELRRNNIDIRRLPKLAVCGNGTAAVFLQAGIIPEICAKRDFGALGLSDLLKEKLAPGDRVIRLKSDAATSKLTEILRSSGAEITDMEFYLNRPLHYQELPDFEAGLFTSGSCVRAFIKNFSPASLQGKSVCVIGIPTECELKKLAPDIEIIKTGTVGIKEMVLALAARVCANKLRRTS